MSAGISPLHALAAELGISAQFRDTLGNNHTASDATVRALVHATGVEAGSSADISASLAALKADPLQEIPVARDGAVNLPLTGPVNWRVTLEDGGVREGRADGTVRITALPVGLHEFTITSSGGTWTTPLPSPPAAAPSAKRLTGTARHWGMAAPVYALPGPCGVGTYTDLGDLASGLGRMGAAYTLINPVHALFPGASEAYSPYSPSHRSFLSIAHIDPASVPEFDASPQAQALFSRAASRRTDNDLVDYSASADTLLPLLEALFDQFEALEPEHPRRQAFETWRRDRGEPLERYAIYEALAERHGPFWTKWPLHLRDVSAFQPDRSLNRAATKHAYFQWLAESQLADAQAKAKAGGMALGLMLDLAVGIRADGAETWAEPGNVAHGVSIGAPPDAFNPSGQNWALAPLNPLAMRSGGLRAFAETLRASMRHAGALRIDHVLGLRRNFWIADETGEGAYIRFPQDALFAVLAIEAERNRCLVVGEDLGNVPMGFRDEMAANGLYGCRLLYFQRTSSGGLIDPADYKPATVASIGSHDLATLREWWNATDLDEMESLGVLIGQSLSDARAQRKTDRRSLCTLLDLADMPGKEAPLAEVHARLAQSGSDLVTLQLEMLLPEGARLNLPGTTTQYPNWRRKLPPILEILSNADLVKTASMATQYRGR